MIRVLYAIHTVMFYHQKMHLDRRILGSVISHNNKTHHMVFKNKPLHTLIDE
jgi:hypothetical protein